MGKQFKSKKDSRCAYNQKYIRKWWRKRKLVATWQANLKELLITHRYYRKRNERGKILKMLQKWRRSFYEYSFCSKWSRWCKARLRNERKINLPVIDSCDKILIRQRRRTNLLIGARYARDASGAIMSTGLLVFQQNVTRKIVDKLTRLNPDKRVNHLEVEGDVLRLMRVREEAASRFKKNADKLKEIAEECLQRAGNAAELSLYDLCGVGEHCRRWEGYFYELGYPLMGFENEYEMEKHLQERAHLSQALRELSATGAPLFYFFDCFNSTDSEHRAQLEQFLRDLNLTVVRRMRADAIPLPFVDEEACAAAVGDDSKANLLAELMDQKTRFCNPETCIFPRDYAATLRSLFTRILQCNDLRTQFAMVLFSRCAHLKHARKFEALAYDEKTFELLGGIFEKTLNEKRAQSRLGVTGTVDARFGFTECEHPEHIRKSKNWKSKETHSEIEGTSRFVAIRTREFCYSRCIEKLVGCNVVWKGGHSLSCVSGHCQSVELFLRRLAVHFPIMRLVLKLYLRLSEEDKLLEEIDDALLRCDYERICALYERETRANVTETEQNSSSRGFVNDDELRDACTDELSLCSWNAAERFMTEIKETPSNVCAGCRITFYKDGGTLYKFVTSEDGLLTAVAADERGTKTLHFECSEQWTELLRAHLSIERDGKLDLTTDLDLAQFMNSEFRIFICTRCITSIRKRGMHSPVSVLNGFLVDVTPELLRNLNFVERQLISPARCFQSVFRLGSIQSKMPVSDRVKAVKGTALFLPLPLEQTLRTVGENFSRTLGEDDHVVVYGVPTRAKVVWKTLINRNRVEQAFEYLKTVNPVYEKYKDVSLRDPFEGLTRDSPLSTQECSDICEHLTLFGKSRRGILSDRIDSADANLESECSENSLGFQGESMLRRIDDEEEQRIVESFTVQSVQKELPRDDDLELFSMERVKAEFLGTNEFDLELLCFPTLFPLGRGSEKFVNTRYSRARSSDYLKSRLYNVAPQFRNEPDYVFYQLHAYRRRAVFSGVMQTLRNTTQFRNCSTSQLIRQIERGEQELEKALNTVFGQLRGSAAFWGRRKMDLQAMVRELGPPTWFVTLSAAEYDWQDMADMLIAMNADVEGISEMRNGERCATDPVNMNRHFHRRFRAFFKYVIMDKQNPPLGVVADYFWRIEYQSRGAPHYHMLLWIDGAPRIGLNTEREVMDFVEKRVTCRSPDQQREPVLHSLVTKYQSHRCSSYCKRRIRRKVKSTGTVRIFFRCRFHFPRRTCEKAVLHDVIASCKKRRGGTCSSRLYELPRRENERRINDYNARMILLWRANMDVQFVGEKTQAIVRYLVSYVTKREQAALQELWTDICKDKSLSQRLFAFGCRALAVRECGIYEAVDILTGQHLFEKSRTIQYICAREPHLRPRQLKTLKQLKAIVEADENSRAKFENSWIDDYYPDRSAELERVCLYDFRKWFDKASNEKPAAKIAVNDAGAFADDAVGADFKADYRIETSDEENSEPCCESTNANFKADWRIDSSADERSDASFETEAESDFFSKLKNQKKKFPFVNSKFGAVQTRSKPHIISHPMFRLSRSPEEYYYALLLLFKPFRNESLELRRPDMSVTEIFGAEFETNSRLRKYHKHMQDLYAEKEAVEKALEEISDADDSEDELGEDQNFVCPVNDADQIADEMRALESTAVTESLHWYLERMNADQTRVFDALTEKLREKKPFRMFLSGAGGTGKSFLVDAIRAWWNEELRLSGKIMAVAAPTGVAASNVKGMTLHKLFQLPVQQNLVSRYAPLSEALAKKLAQNMKGLKLLIVDEVSMVSNVMLLFFHDRMRQIFRNYDEFFGGISVLFMGDFAQLTPVGDGSVFEDIETEVIESKMGALRGPNLWKEALTDYAELTVTMRQKADVRFGELLDRLRYGNLSAEDARLLDTRTISLNPETSHLRCLVDYYFDLLKERTSLLCLLPTTNMVNEFNAAVLLHDSRRIVTADSQDKFLYEKRKQKGDFQKLLREQGSKASATGGIEQSLRLKEGARVMLRRNLNVEAGLVNGALGTVSKIIHKGGSVNIVEVKFDRIETVQRIERACSYFPLAPGVKVERKQFPLILAYAITIHKSQGITTTDAMIDVGNNVFVAGMTYVALSRVRTLSGLHLINFDRKCAVANKACIEEVNRLRQQFDRGTPSIELVKTSFPSTRDRPWCSVKIGFNPLLKERKSQQSRATRLVLEKQLDSTAHSTHAEKRVGKRKANRLTSESEVSEQKRRKTDSLIWPAFRNQDGKTCYANAALQLLFASDEFCRFAREDSEANITQAKVQNALRSLVQKYENGKVQKMAALGTASLRNALYALNLNYTFRVEDDQQDALHFMQSLLESTQSDKLFRITVAETISCSRPGCDFQKETVQNDIVWNAELTDSMLLEEMLEGSWKEMPEYGCDSCGVTDACRSKTFLRSVSRYLILRLSRYTVSFETLFNNREIRNCDPDSIRLCGKRMRIVAVVFHEAAMSQKISEDSYVLTANSGHYTAAVRTRNDAWLLCNDAHVSAVAEFPTGLRNAVLLLLECYQD